MSIRIRYYPEGSTLMHERVVNEVIGEHLQILDAARQHDAAQMAELVRCHLQNGERRAMSALAGKN